MNDIIIFGSMSITWLSIAFLGVIFPEITKPVTSIFGYNEISAVVWMSISFISGIVIWFCLCCILNWLVGKLKGRNDEINGKWLIPPNHKEVEYIGENL